MGKIKRVRQKLHQSALKDNDQKLNTFQVVCDSKEQPLAGKSPLLKTDEELALIPDNLFEGIDINFENLNKKLEDDKVSVRSIVKSCKYDSKGKLLKKKEKQKLKHDIFMRKINTVQQLKKEALLKHKKRKSLRKSGIKMDTFIHNSPAGMEISSHNESVNTNIDCYNNKDKKLKCKGIKKAKVRQREMLEGVSAFQKILADSAFIKDPCAKITECVKRRIIKERS